MDPDRDKKCQSPFIYDGWFKSICRLQSKRSWYHWVSILSGTCPVNGRAYRYWWLKRSYQKECAWPDSETYYKRWYFCIHQLQYALRVWYRKWWRYRSSWKQTYPCGRRTVTEPVPYRSFQIRESSTWENDHIRFRWYFPTESDQH